MMSPRANLRNNLSESFNLSEIQDLCFDLNIDYENLHGQTKNEKSRAIIEFCEQNVMLHALIEWCEIKRPHTIWLTEDERSSLLNNVVSNNEAENKTDPLNASSESEEEKQLRLIYESVVDYFCLDSTDQEHLLELITSKLGRVIPEYTEILYKGRFFTKKKTVQRVIVHLNNWQYIIEERMHLSCFRKQVVKDIILKTETLILNDWIRMLSMDLTLLAQNHQHIKRFFLKGQ